MTNQIAFRPAIENDAKALSALAIRSKAHWGYSQDFMDACVDEMSVTEDYITDESIRNILAERSNVLLGFYALEDMRGDEIELGALFVDPPFIGQGVGRALIDHAKTHALSLGAGKLVIQGDPHAESFYIAAGGLPTGQKESQSIPGRFLPTFEIRLTVNR